MRSIEDQAQIIRNAGYRLTRAREAVLHVLAQADGSLDAAAIHRRGRRIHGALGRVSVYRALDLLEELNLVRQLHGEDGCHTYARADRPQGHYLVCQWCGQVTEFPCVGLEEWLDTVGRRSGFEIRKHLVQLEGICGACRRRGNTDGPVDRPPMRK
jgi:Fe2+ or Zn2+ uptake regulation protein